MTDKNKEPRVAPASWQPMLKATPVRNAAAQARPSDGQSMLISVQARKPFFLIPPLSWIIRPRLKRDMQIDAVGAQVWNLCDGLKTVENIVDSFAAAYQLTFHEARVAVTGYLKLLVQRGAVAMVTAK